MRELFSDSVTSSKSQSTFQLQPDQYEKLMFRFAVTTAAGQTLTAADLGEVQVSDGRGQPSRIDFASLQDRAFARGGILQDVTGNAAAAENVAIPYYFALPDDPSSIFEVGVVENVTVRIFYSANLATRIGGNTMTVTVTGVTKDGVQNYRLLHNRFDVAIQSGLTTKLLPFENVHEILMERTSNISRVRVTSEGDELYNGALNDLIQLTHEENKLETFSSTPNKLILPINRTDEIEDSFHDNVQVQIDGSGADTITLYVVSIDPTPEEQLATRQKKLNVTESRLTKKAAEGRTRPIKILAQAE